MCSLSDDKLRVAMSQALDLKPDYFEHHNTESLSSGETLRLCLEEGTEMIMTACQFDNQ